MANYKTGAQRYNDRMDKIFKKSEELGNHTLHGSTEKSSAKSKALEKKIGVKSQSQSRELYPYSSGEKGKLKMKSPNVRTIKG